MKCATPLGEQWHRPCILVDLFNTLVAIPLLEQRERRLRIIIRSLRNLDSLTEVQTR